MKTNINSHNTHILNEGDKLYCRRGTGQHGKGLVKRKIYTFHKLSGPLIKLKELPDKSYMPNRFTLIKPEINITLDEELFTL